MGVRDPLHAAADDSQRQGVGSGQQPRRKYRAAGGAQGGDVRAVHDDQWRPGLRIEETDQRLVTGQAARGIAVERGDEFYPHRAAGEPAGHGPQEPVWRVDPGATRRHNVPRAQLRESLAECLQHCRGIEQTLDVFLAQEQQWHWLISDRSSVRTPPSVPSS